MSTLTHLEDYLRQPDSDMAPLLSLLDEARHCLDTALKKPEKKTQYTQLTLLHKAVIQAEDIIKVIYYRYQFSKDPTLAQPGSK